MKSTSDIMIKRSGTKWKQIKKHVRRTQKVDSNKNIKRNRPGHNIYGKLDNYRDLMKKQLSPYIRAYNRKCIKQRKKSRVYGKLLKNGRGYRKYDNPVDDFLRRSKRKNERLMIFYLGNRDTRANYYRYLHKNYGLDTATIRDIENRSLVNSAKVWNRGNPYLKICDYATNTDESTAHIHTRLVATNIFGKKRDMAVKREKDKGIHHFIRKPSMSFNKALIATYSDTKNKHGRVDSRQAMKAMRKRFDPVIIQQFNKELKKNGIGLHLSLARTGKVNHFTLEEYKAQKDLVKMNSEVSVVKHNGKALSSYLRSSAVSEAQPMINTTISENESEAQNSAYMSASISANQSLQFAKESAKSSFAQSNYDWITGQRFSLNSSAHKVIKKSMAKSKAELRASVSSVAQAKSSTDSLSGSLDFTMASFVASGQSMVGETSDTARRYLTIQNIMKPRNKLIKDFNNKVRKFENEHKWAMRIVQKLHHYHLHLKQLFKKLLPKESNNNLNEFAHGDRWFKAHPHERQEDIIFRLEDSNAKDISHQAQKANENIFNDNRSYKSTPEPRKLIHRDNDLEQH